MKTLGALIPLLITAGILLAGNGLQGTLVALRAGHEGFGTMMIGVMGMVYYGGFLVSCLYSAGLIRAFGHIRVFAALAATASAGSLALVLIIDPVVWIVIRAAMGFCIAGLMMVIESWLAENSPRTDRARILSIYVMVDLVVVTGSQFLMPLFGIGGFELFAIMAMLFAFSLVPVSLSNSSIPKPPEEFQFSVSKVWQISPIAMTGVLAIGMTNSAFRLVGPVYGQAVGLDVTGVALFISAGIIGGAVLQYPLGQLSDRYDRRWVLVGATVGAALAGFYLASIGSDRQILIYSGAFVFGAFAMPLYSLSAAHANDHAKSGQFVLVSAGLLFFYSLGATVGPLIASLVIEWVSAPAFFAYTGVVHMSLLIATLIRMGQRPAIPASARRPFVYLLKTSPAFFRLSRRKRGEADTSGVDKPTPEFDATKRNRRQSRTHAL